MTETGRTGAGPSHQTAVSDGTPGRPARALIAGAGIGGLAAAIALRRTGIEPIVFERATTLEPVGAGLLLTPNAGKALELLGLLDAVARIAAPVERAEIRAASGQVLQCASMADLGRMLGAPTLGVHRADLQALLLNALNPATVRLGAECTGFRQDESGIVAHFADGWEERGDLLIGADGLHSAVRRQIHGDRPPRYAGYTAWRAVTPFRHPRFPEGQSLETWGCGARFGMVHVGQGRVYWFATKNAPEGDVTRSKEALLRLFRGWHEPIEAVIAATDEASILRNDIFDRPPIVRWGTGRVTLLGDAAHPATPNLGQGACQALEDAVVLAACLRREASVEAALRTYEALRAPRTARITTLSWRLGKIAQWEHPIACWARDWATRLTPDRLSLRQATSLLRFDPPEMPTVARGEPAGDPGVSRSR